MTWCGGVMLDPTLGAMKLRRRWGTRTFVARGGKQIPSLRYGMEMQRQEDWDIFYMKVLFHC